jgi:alpha/beta superfamily hydrolase
MSIIPGSAATIESGGLKLEALLHLPDGASPFPGLVICHPHPENGGDMYNGVVGAIVQASLDAGVAALRFNFRGVGGSEGEHEGGAGELEDVGAAVSHLMLRSEIDSSRVALAGYSFGAVMALRFADTRPDLAAVIAVSQPTMAASRAEIYMDPPVLIVAGDRDQYCDINLLQEYRSRLAEDVELEIVPGADHFWWGSFDRLQDIVSGFLSRRLSVVGSE